jgi:RNA polymerase sigma factor (TIGR02999 family)
MSDSEIAQLLTHWGGQDREAMDVLLATVYDQLRRLARHHLRNERGTHTLSATGLVHEAWMKLANERDHNWKNRAHFFGAASQAMRRLLVDYARGRAALKRGGDQVTLTAVEDVVQVSSSIDELLAIDHALEGLSAINARLVRVVECRYFGGLTIPETAEALGVSHTTVSDDWRFARAWLRRALEPAESRPM